MLAHDVTVGFFDDTASYSRNVSAAAVVYSPRSDSAEIGSERLFADLANGFDVSVTTEGDGNQLGDLTFESAFGAGTDRNSLHLQAANDLNFIASSIRSVSIDAEVGGSFNLIGNSTIDANTGHIDVNAGEISVGVGSTFGGVAAPVILQADEVEFAGPLGSDLKLANLNVTAAEIVVSGDITSSGSQTFQGPLTIVGGPNLKIESLDGAIRFNSTINDAVNDFSDLKIQSGETTTFADDIGALSRLNSVEVFTDATVEFADAGSWQMGVPFVRQGIFMHNVASKSDGQSISVSTPTPWQNLVRNSDVDNNGDVTLVDALIIINQLGNRKFVQNDSSQMVDPAEVTDWPNLYFDQSGDNRLSPIDALRVINELARNQVGLAAGDQNPMVDEESTDAVFAEQEPTLF